VLFFIAACQRTIYSFNLVMYSNVCEYLWVRLQFVRFLWQINQINDLNHLI